MEEWQWRALEAWQPETPSIDHQAANVEMDMNMEMEMDVDLDGYLYSDTDLEQSELESPVQDDVLMTVDDEVEDEKMDLLLSASADEEEREEDEGNYYDEVEDEAEGEGEYLDEEEVEVEETEQSDEKEAAKEHEDGYDGDDERAQANKALLSIETDPQRPGDANFDGRRNPHWQFRVERVFGREFLDRWLDMEEMLDEFVDERREARWPAQDRHRRLWTRDEAKRLYKLRSWDLPFSEIGPLMNRSSSSCRSYWHKHLREGNI